MSLADEYKRQFKWRDWDRALTLCPIKPGQNILDLGCGPGDLSRKLVERNVIVTGVDSNGDLLAVARKECPKNCSFVERDLRSIDLGDVEKYDGIWCSFSAAYFVDFEKVFQGWMKYLTPNAWVCLVEMDNLFNHHPLSRPTVERIEAFYQDAFNGGRYDYAAGRKLEGVLKRAGFTVQSYQLKDTELASHGPADSEVAKAWENRFNRMGGLKNFLGQDFPNFRDEFLQCLVSQEHRSECNVVCSVGTR